MASTGERVSQRAALLVAAIMLVAGSSPMSAPVAAQSSTGATLSAIGPTLERRLQDVIDAARPSEGVPGISAAVATPEDLWLGVTGKASLDLHKGDPVAPVRDDTPFEIGSVTKTFVAAVVLELSQEGRLSLDDHLSLWETKVPDARRITVRELLSHTSGVRDMWRNPSYHRRVEGRPNHVWTYPEVRAMIGPPRFRPGTAFEYSNSNYVLLGHIIERVTGHSVAQEIRTRLLDPLHLDSTWYQGAETGPRTVAMGYKRLNGRWIPQGDGTGLRPTTSIATFFGSAGAMVSTPRDLATWARALYGGHVLTAASLRLMTHFNAHDYGLGTRRVIMGGRVAWGHGGSLDGFETSMWYLPSLDVSVVIIWNRRELDTDPVASRLARKVVESLDPDVTPPSVGTPRIGLHTGATVATGRVPVVVSWPPGQDAQGRVVGYQVRRRSDGGPWQTVPLSTPGSRSVGLSLPIGHTAVIAIRAIDDSGNASGWVAAQPVIPRLVDESDGAVEAGPGWRSHIESDALGGRVLMSETAGSRLTVQASTLALAIVGPRSRLLTASWVRVDGQPGVVVAARASRRRPRQVLLSRHWSTGTTTHTLRIMVPAARHPRVEVDGFLLLQASPGAP